MLVSIDLVDLAINLESRVHDSVGIAAGNTTQVRVLLVDLVVASIVEAKDNVTLLAVDVLNEEVADRGTVRDEVRANALARDLVLAVVVSASTVAGRLRLGESEERESREDSGEAGEHCCGDWSWYRGLWMDGCRSVRRVVDPGLEGSALHKQKNGARA